MKTTNFSGMAKKAEMGVGVLIVFIAMLLVAAVAAGVLITTVTSLQQKALVTGQEARGEVSNHLQVVEVRAIDGRGGGVLNYSILIKLASGSDPIDMNDTLVRMMVSNSSESYALRFTAPSTDLSSSSYYNLTYEVRGPQSRNGFLTRGDIARMNLVGVRNVTSDELVRFTMIPKVGTPSAVEFRTPEFIGTETVYLFP